MFLPSKFEVLFGSRLRLGQALSVTQASRTRAKQTCCCEQQIVLEKRVGRVLHSKHTDEGGVKTEVEWSVSEALFPFVIGIRQYRVPECLRVTLVEVAVGGHQATKSPE